MGGDSKILLIALTLIIAFTGCETATERRKANAEATAALKSLGGRIWDGGHIIDLDNSRITDADLEHTKHVTKLIGLSLSDTNIGDAGLEHLSRLKNLKSLNLDNTQITDAGLGQLKGLANLRTLSLEGTQITDSGLSEFKSARPDCTITREP